MKSQKVGEKPRESSHSLLWPVLSVLFLTTVVSCGDPLGYFSEYQGVDLIAGTEFDFVESGSALSWIDNENRVKVENVNGPPGGALRIAALNQFPNGDFSSNLDLNTWKLTNSDHASILVDSGKLNYSRNHAPYWAYVDLKAENSGFPEFGVGTQGNLSMEVQVVGDPEIGFFGFGFNGPEILEDPLNLDSMSPELSLRQNLVPDEQKELRLSQVIGEGKGSILLLAGTTKAQFEIDNMQLFELPPELYAIELQIPKVPIPGLSLQAGGHFLLTTSLSQEPPEPTMAPYITIELIAYGETGDSLVSESERISTAGIVPGEWSVTDVLIANPLSNAVLSTLSADDNALGIRIYPFNREYPETSELLVAKPRLIWNPSKL